ncbi:MAG: S8 family serine peptidase [Myxococcales bacterium]|nr:S8 family serine peptidase [Myxococcales bacterium]
MSLNIRSTGGFTFDSPEATFMAGLLANTTSDPGFANAAQLHVANFVLGDSEASDIDWAVAQGAFIHSQSWAYVAETQNATFSGRDQYLDWRTRESARLYVLSAGNDDADEMHHKGYNLLVVGGVWSDGLIADGAPPGADSCTTASSYRSTWRNDAAGQELPHLVAPAGCTQAVGLEYAGSSVIPPAIAGIAAGITEYETSLQGWPEALKAILMASPDAAGNASPDGCPWGTYGVSCAGSDGRDGTGLVHGENARSMAANRQPGTFTPARFGYDLGSMAKSDFSSSSPHLFSTTHYAQAAAGCPSFENLRIVLAWDSNVTCTAGSTGSCTDTLGMDLDLRVYEEPGGTLVAQSSSTTNSYEHVEDLLIRGPQGNCTPTGSLWYYRIEIALANYSSVTSETTFYGLAWHTY